MTGLGVSRTRGVALWAVVEAVKGEGQGRGRAVGGGHSFEEKKTFNFL